MRRHIAVTTVAALLLAAAGPAGAGGIVRSLPGMPPGDQWALTPPPAAPPDALTPAVALRRVVATIDALIAERADPALAEARAAVLDAAVRLADAGVEPWASIDTALRSIGTAVAALGRAVPPSREDTRIARAQETLARVAGRVATTMVDRAERGGVDRATIAQARADLAEGNRLIGEASYGLAIFHFGQAFKSGEALHFDMDRFEQLIWLGMAGEAVGYSYAITLHGQLDRDGAFGEARTDADGSPVAQSSTKEMNIASVSKTITAVAVMQRLEALGIDIDDSIEPWLPPTWVTGPGIDDLTFRDLLTHESGLYLNVTEDPDLGLGYTYDALRQYIALGINPDYKVFVYQNANFAMFRILIPYLWPNAWPVLEWAESLEESQPGTLDSTTAYLYWLYVFQSVLVPSGVTAACAPSDTDPTLLYRFPYDGSIGVDAGDWSAICGSGGWYLSAVELAAFLAHIRFDDGVLSDQARAIMNQNSLGWMDKDNYWWITGDYLAYRMHGGDLLYGPEPWKGVDTCIADFPIEVQVALLINSQGATDYGGNGAYQCEFLGDAFDGAWVA